MSSPQTLEIGGKIVFQDDGPTLTGLDEAKTVNEDDVATASSIGTSPHWSFLPDGENDGDDSYTTFPVGPAVTSGNLAGLVASGADDPVTFGFSDNALQYLEGLQLYSKQTATGDGENGKLLTYTLSPTATRSRPRSPIRTAIASSSSSSIRRPANTSSGSTTS